MSIRNVEDIGKRRRLTVTIFFVLVVVALLVGAVVTIQRAGQGPSENPEIVVSTSPKEGENREWTPDRMRRASPASMPRRPKFRKQS
jgi:hypothetical protein